MATTDYTLNFTRSNTYTNGAPIPESAHAGYDVYTRTNAADDFELLAEFAAGTESGTVALQNGLITELRVVQLVSDSDGIVESAPRTISVTVAGEPPVVEDTASGTPSVSATEA